MLAHDVLGTGPVTVALLHGVGGGRCIWDAEHSGTAQALAGAGYRVIALDMPGYGDSALPDAMSSALMARQVAQTLCSLQARPAVLLGHSMGGMVAQELAVSDPQAVSALVLACTSPAFGKPGGDWQQQFLNDRLAPLDQGLGMPALARRLVAAMMSPNSTADALERAVNVMSRVPEATYRAALRAIVGFDRRESLAALTMPVLCLAAEDDRTAPPDVMQRMASRMPQAHYRCLAGTGHLANVEAPAAFAQAVIEFLETHGPARTGR